MSLQDRLDEMIEAEAQRRCPAERLLAGMPEAERASLEAALTGNRMSTLKIHAALRLEGYHIGRDSLQSHRSQRCACHREDER